LKEPGKKPQSKSYMWLYRSGSDGDPPIVLYDYKPSRGGSNAADYLQGFHGYLHTDYSDKKVIPIFPDFLSKISAPAA